MLISVSEGSSNSSNIDSNLKEFTDILNLLKSVKKKSEEAGSSLVNTSIHEGERRFLGGVGW